MRATKEIMKRRILFIRNNLHLGNIAISKRLNITTDNIEIIMKRYKIKRPIEIVRKIRLKAGRKGSKVTHSKYKFDKQNNPNWKGGISTDFYRYKKIQIKRYPEKISARNKVHKAVKSGKLKRSPCKICGKRQSFAHHKDYSKPLDVEWYCRKHHRERHQ